MSLFLKYKIGEKLLSDAEIMERAYRKAETMVEPTKSQFLLALRKKFEHIQEMELAEQQHGQRLELGKQHHEQKITHMNKIWLGIIVPTLGLILLGICVYLAFLAPNPTRFQSGIIWITLCLGVGLSCALIPGYLIIDKFPGWRAGGGLAVAAGIYLVLPVVMNEDFSSQSLKMKLYVAVEDTISVHKFNVDFDNHSSDLLTTFAAAKYTEYIGSPCIADSIVCFRKSDGKIYVNELCSTITDTSIMIINKRLVNLFGTSRSAWKHYLDKCN